METRENPGIHAGFGGGNRTIISSPFDSGLLLPANGAQSNLRVTRE